MTDADRDAMMYDAINALDMALDNDANAIQLLLGNRVRCNRALADHPTVVCDTDCDGFTVGSLGLINGILDAMGLPRIAAQIEDDGSIAGFCRYVEESAK